MTTINPSPRPYLDRLAATVEQLGAVRSVLRQVIALAGDSATLSNEQLRDRLTALAEACDRCWYLRSTADRDTHRGELHPDPTEADTCPGCGTTHGVQRITGTSPTVQAGMCAACGMHWACTVANPTLSIISLLPTPQLRTAAFLAVLHIEVTRRSGKEPGTMTVTVCLPVTS